MKVRQKVKIRFYFQLVVYGIIFIFFSNCNVLNRGGYNLPKYDIDIIPDSTTAVKIAEIICLNIYGDKILSEKPYSAKLIKNKWVVQGSTNGRMGGAFYIEIDKRNSKVIKFTHFR